MINSSVRDETARQAVILVFTVATFGLIMWMSQPDAWRTLKMVSALHARRFAESQVVWWETVRDQASTIYNRERN